MGGKPVRGFAFYERSLALYRDWELADVLSTAVDVGELRSLIDRGRAKEAVEWLQKVDAPTPEVGVLVDDLISALRRG